MKTWKCLVLRVAACAASLLAGTVPAQAQRDAVSFAIGVENDTFTNSDTGYTNGVRLSWTIQRFRRGMRLFTDYNLATTLDAGLGVIGLDGLRLDRLGFIPDSMANTKCDVDTIERAFRELGACTLLTLGIAQTIYTPDSLATSRPQPRDQPYAGFLYATAGVVTLDSPRARDSTHWLSYTEVSNQVLLGVTGPAALAEQTQSLAHWTLSTGSHRPLGWRNQLRSAVQVGLITDIAVRPQKWEFCRKGCTGLIDERRWLDFTPHVEAVASTHMVRLSQGITGRLGMDFPDMVGTLRIPATVPQSGRGPRRGIVILGERYWWYVFGNAETRFVPYNMFLAGGIADGGRTGWRTIREITPRRHVMESAYGFAVGSSRMSARGQYAFRTPEYDVDRFRRSHGLHGYGSITLSINTRAQAAR
jgi:lipid A 3-O-deacylase